MIATVIKKIQIVGLFVLAFLLVAQGAQAAITITRTSSPVFYSDITNGLTDGYAAYRITTDVAVTDCWAQIGGFSGPNISLSTYEDGLYHLGPMAAGSSKMVYFYLHTAAVSAGSESHTIYLYDGKPPGGTFRGSQSFSLTQRDTIQANASKVTSIITGPNPATLGGLITLTITGETGTTNGPLAFTPATDSGWHADAYELFSSVVTLPNGTTLTDAPYTATYSGTSGTYVGVFLFTAKGAVTAPSAVSSIGYIDSGTQIKHTQTGSSAGYTPPPIIDPTTGNAVVLTKLADKMILPPGIGGTVTYTLRLTNNGSIDVTLDDLVDTLPSSPASASYVNGSSKYNGISIANPAVSGSQLTWSGVFTVPALSTRDLTFQASIPGTAGTYTNRAVGHIGTTQIDTTVATSDNAPATASLNVTTATTLAKAFNPAIIGAGQQSTLTLTITNGQGNPAQSNLGFTDLLPANVTVVGAPSTPQCGGMVNYNAGTNTLSLSGGTMAAGTANCSVGVTVTSNVAGTYLNAYNNNPALSNISNVTGGVDPANASATLQVSTPTLSKAFEPNTINANQTSDLTFTVTNGSGNPAQAGLAFTDTLPSGVVVVTPPVTSTTCGGGVYKAGTTNALAGGETAVTFSGGAQAANSPSCTVTVRVKPSSGTLTTYTNGSANMSNLSAGLINGVTNQTLTIVNTPTLTKAFSPTTIGVNTVAAPGSSATFSTLTFTINNPAGQSQTKLSFTDLFPAGLVVAVPTGVTSSCGGNVYRTGTTTALTGGEAALDFANGSVGANTSCTVSVNVTSAAVGSYTNSSANITTVSGLANAVAPSTLSVTGTTLAKAFGVSSIITGATTSLTLTVTNGTGDPLQSGFGFTDTLPAGLTVTAAAASQCNGTVSFTPSSFTLSGGKLTPTGTHACTITATVRGSASGTYTNSSANITTSGGLDASSATATISVGSAPTIQVTKALVSPGRIATSDQFVVQITDTGGTSIGTTAASTTSGNGASVTTGTGTSSYTASSLGSAYRLDESMSPGSATSLSRYLVSVSCANNGVPVATPTALGQNFIPLAGDNYVCTITNTPAPSLQVRKTLTSPGRIASSDQFTIQIKDNTGALLGTSTSTGGSGATVTAGTGTSSYTAIALGGIYSFNEVMTGGSSSTLAQYAAVVSCTNNGFAVASPTALGQSFTPAAGDNYVCTITNTPARVTVRKLTNGGTGVFSFTGTNGIPANFAIDTTSANPQGSVTYPIVAVNTQTTISETVPAGWTLTGASCVDGSNNPVAGTTLGNGTLTIPAAAIIAGANLTCTFTNDKNATITVNKALFPTSDGGRFNLLVGGSTVAMNIGDTGTGNASVPANTVVTVSEAAYTGTSLTDYTSTYSCTGGISGAGTSVNITPAPGQAITCSFTNTRKGVNVSGTIYYDVNHNGIMDGGETGTGQALFVKLSPRSGATCAALATAAVAADPATGAFTLATVPQGDYCLILGNNAALSDITPTYPSGWIGLEIPSGMRPVTVGTTPLIAQNFGMYNGGRLSGRVFEDTGTGGGTPNNGIQDGSEGGLAGVTVRLIDNGGGAVLASAVTTGSGDYELWIPAAAGSTSLKVVETNLAGYVSTGGNVGTTGGSYTRANDTVLFTNTVGTTYLGVNFADVPGNTFAANNSRSVLPGGVVFYPHTFTAGTGGTVTFAINSVASPAIAGWSEVLYLDSNCNGSIDAGEPQITGPLPTSAGQPVCILVKEFAPATAPVNAMNNLTVTASFGYSNSTLQPASLAVTDLTTVSQSGLTLLKFVDKSSAVPGDTLTYTISYINTGSSQLTNIVLTDNVPPFTNSPSACCVNPSTACLGAPPASYPASITGCTIVTTSSTVMWTLNGTLAPGASGQVKFSVKIDQ